MRYEKVTESGAILFKRSEESKQLDRLLSRIEELEKKVETLMKELEQLKK